MSEANSDHFQAGAEEVAEYERRLPSAHWHGGYLWPGVLVSPDRLDAVKSLPFRPDDVLIVSYPKSGTTWASELVSALAAGGDLTAVRSRRQHERVPWLELDTSLFHVRFFTVLRSVKAMLGWATPPAVNGAEGGGPRVRFTHLPLHMLPQDVLDGKCKMIYVARNPKDTMVSFWHFHKMGRFLGEQTQLPFSTFFNLFLDGRIYSGSWFKHVLSYWKFCKDNKNSSLFLKYEDMKKDLGSELDRVCDFLGTKLDLDVRRNLIDHCSFDSMKDNSMANREGLPLFNQNVSKFMRKGVVGDWKEHFTVAQSELFDQVYAQRMDGSDLSFCFTLPHQEDEAGDKKIDATSKDTHL